MQKSTEIKTEVIGQRHVPEGKSDYWWEQKGDADTASAMTAAARSCEVDSQDRIETALMHMCLYHNARTSSLRAAGFNRTSGDWKSANGVSGTIGSLSKYNVIKSVVDTGYNMLAKNRPRVVPLTTGGDWSKRRTAKLMRRFLDGSFEQLKIYDLMRDAYLDASIFDTGIIVFGVEGEKITAERGIPTEFSVDEDDAVYGKPRTLYWHKTVKRSVLQRMFTKKSAEIGMVKAAAQNRPSKKSHRTDDSIDVYEAWHLPVIVQELDDKGRWRGVPYDGRHVVACGDVILCDEPYKRDRFPIVTFRWTRRRIGYWGQSLTEDLVGLQLEINDMLKRAQIANRRQATPRVFVESGSRVTEKSLTSEIGGVVYYSGQRPVFDTPSSFGPDWYNHLERIKQWAHEMAGISELSAGAKKPAGIDSGAALREYNNIENARQVTHGQDYEQLAIDIAEMIQILAREMYEDGVDCKVSSDVENFIESIKWSEVASDDPYHLKLFPTSSLPTHPSARLETVSEMYKAGFIVDKNEAMRLLDFPDLEEKLSLQLAAIDEVLRVIEQIEDDGKYEAPEPQINLPYAIEMSQAAYLRGRTGGMPDARLDMLLRYGEEALALRGAAVAPAPQSQQTPPGPPALGALPGAVESPALPSALPAMPPAVPV
jgi:hypothetical protein